jgi:hypothetical protein
MNILERIFKKNAVEESIVIVSGLPRSGTSMLMRMLDAGGLPPLTDNERSADDDNPKGYYEFEPVKKLREGDRTWLPRAQGKAVKIISALLEYLPAERQYRVLFMQRAIAEVLASQRQMLIRRGEDPDKVGDAEMAQYFQKHLAQVKDWLAKQKNIRVLYLDYNELVRNPGPQVREINAFLGNRLDETQMMAMIDPSLYRQRKAS